MSTYFATPSALLGWLKSVAADNRLVAPKTKGSVVLFKSWSSEDVGACQDVSELLKRTTMSAKEVVIPKCETLYELKATKDSEDLSKLHQELVVPEFVKNGAQATVLFGSRPCDARGMTYLDQPYLEGPFVDPYYKARREALVVITQACTNALSTCFCNWVGSHPADEKASDIIFTPVDNGFYFVGITEKGKALLEKAGFENADDAKKKAAVEAQEKAKTQLPPPSELKGIPEKVYARFNDEAFWNKEIEKCLSCGACTYLCPTCQCFTITDKGNQLDGKRMRSWDGCMAPHFTLEASGHNPRPSRGLRYRNRLSHKFSYGRKDGDFSCVGCGRCVRSCPAHLDIRAVCKHACEPANEAPKA